MLIINDHGGGGGGAGVAGGGVGGLGPVVGCGVGCVVGIAGLNDVLLRIGLLRSELSTAEIFRLFVATGCCEGGGPIAVLFNGWLNSSSER